MNADLNIHDIDSIEVLSGFCDKPYLKSRPSLFLTSLIREGPILDYASCLYRPKPISSLKTPQNRLTFYKMKKPFLILLLAFLVSSCGFSGNQIASVTDSSSSSPDESSSQAPVFEIADELKNSLAMIVSARKGYENPLSENEIILGAGYVSGDTLEADYDTLLRLLQSAFSSLLAKEEKIGSRLYMQNVSSEKKVETTDQRGREALSWLDSYGLWGESDYKGSDPFDANSTRTFLQRIFGYLGAKPEEDYFTYANSDRLFDSSMNFSAADSFYEQKIVDENSIADFYVNFLNQDSPALYSDFINGIGLTCLKEEADKIYNATADTFWNVASGVSEDLGSYFFSFMTSFVQFDLNNLRISLTGSDKIAAFAEISDNPSSLQKLFSSFGYENDVASSLGEALSSCVDHILESSLDYGTLHEDAKNYFQAQVGEGVTFSFNDVTTFRALTYLNQDIDEENLLNFKAYALACLAYDYRSLLNQETRTTLGFASENNLHQDFLSLTSEALQCYFVNAYSSSEKGKRAYQKAYDLGKEVVSTIQGRLEENAWLSEKGQEAISSKLSKLGFIVGGACESHPSFSGVFDTSSLEKAIHSGLRAYWDNLRNDAKKMKRIELISSLYGDSLMPNAMYIPSINSVCITLGLMTSYGNDLTDLKDEDLYGAFLTAFGHEITHSIDSNGVKTDEDGFDLEEPILGEEDMKAYEEKQEKVKALHWFESLPGELQDSSKTLGEDIADLGGLTISEIIYQKNAAKVDWEAYYKSIGRHFYSNCSHSSWEEKFRKDVHSFGKPRVNALLSNSKRFLETYNVSPLNGMYVSSADQVVVW